MINIKKENKPIVTAIVIILVVLLAVNFNKLTGQAVRAHTTLIDISPGIVELDESGKSVTVVSYTLSPGSKGYSSEIEIRKEGIRKKIDSVRGCSSKCMDPVTKDLSIPTDWGKGVYEIRVKDNVLSGYVSANFKVV